MLPDISKNDLLNLVKILYGGHRQENQTHCSSELLHMLGIEKLPKLIPKQQNTSITREYKICFLFGNSQNQLEFYAKYTTIPRPSVHITEYVMCKGQETSV